VGYLAMLFEDKLKADGLWKMVEERHRENKDMTDKYDVLKEKANFTSGKLCSNGIFSLTNDKLLNCAQEMESKKQQKQQATDDFNKNKEQNKRQKLQETIRRLTGNENLRRDDHTAILRKYYDAKTDPKITNINTSTEKDYFEAWGLMRQMADLVVMNNNAVNNPAIEQNVLAEVSTSAIVAALNSPTVDV
jgi:hypothetical protein